LSCSVQFRTNAVDQLLLAAGRDRENKMKAVLLHTYKQLLLGQQTRPQHKVANSSNERRRGRQAGRKATYSNIIIQI